MLHAEYALIQQIFTEHLQCAGPSAENTDMNKTAKVSALKELVSWIGESINMERNLGNDFGYGH